MFLFLPLVFCLAVFISCTYVSTNQCDPANFICSGRCPDVPPEVKLPYGVAICMKDLQTGACVCWLQNDDVHQGDSLFLCEARVNETDAQILCHIPTHCFPPDSEPTCLVIPFCDCLLLSDDGSAVLQFGSWKPVKAFVQMTDHSKMHPDDVREFSLKHLLFLLGFVIAPLLCWCLLNFINDNRCKRKPSNAVETRPATTSRAISRPVADTLEEPQATDPLTHDSECSSDQHAPCSVPIICISRGNDAICLTSHSPVSSAQTIVKQCESPPSYDEAISHDSEHKDDEDGPPPSYEDAIKGRDPSTLPNWQTLFVIHSGPCQNT